MKLSGVILSTVALLFSTIGKAQYIPADFSKKAMKDAQKWVDQKYANLSQSHKLGQLFIVALYTNKGQEHIQQIRRLVEKEHIGGLILMQDDAERHIQLVNEFQQKSPVPLMIGMDAEWGVYQRIATAYKYPWAITLGAIQDKNRITEMAASIARDCQRMGVNWDFAPTADVNTNPNNPVIGNRSFGSEPQNVIASAFAYAQGLQRNNVLAAIKHFPGHGDTDQDSHLDIPLVSHPLSRLNEVELAPFRELAHRGIGGIMVAHLYVPVLEHEKNIPASVSYNVITKLLKEKIGYQGLIITDALNMGAVANKYKAGELDALAFKAGNDIMLFSQDVETGKKLIQQAIDRGEISQKRLEESVKKILMTKYVLGLTQYTPRNPENINQDLNNAAHQKLMQSLYADALTLIKDEKKILPLDCSKTYYFVPLEEAPHERFLETLQLGTTVIKKQPAEIATIPAGATVIVGVHKDNSTAYKPYQVSEASKKIIDNLSAKHPVLLNIFGSPYALRDLNISPVSTVLVSYENNDDSMKATASALNGNTTIHGKLPVLVNDDLPAGTGMQKNAATRIQLPAKH